MFKIGDKIKVNEEIFRKNMNSFPPDMVDACWNIAKDASIVTDKYYEGKLFTLGNNNQKFICSGFKEEELIGE